MKATLAALLLAGLFGAGVKFAADSERKAQARAAAVPPRAQAPPAAAPPQPQPPPPTPPPPQPGPPVQQWWVYRGGFGGRPGVHPLYGADGKLNIDPKGDFWVGPFADFASAQAAYVNTYMKQQGGSFGP